MKNLKQLDQQVNELKLSLAERACRLLLDVEHEWYDSHPDSNFPIDTSLCHDVPLIDEVVVDNDDNVVIITLDYIDPYDDICDQHNTLQISYGVFVSEVDQVVKDYFYQQAKSLSETQCHNNFIAIVRDVSCDLTNYEKAVKLCKDNNLSGKTSYNDIRKIVEEDYYEND